MVTGDNPFIRFKNHINSNVRRGLDLLFGSPPSTSVSTSTPDPVLLHDGLVSAPTHSTSPSLQQQRQLQPSSSPSPSLKMTDKTSAPATTLQQPEQDTVTTMDEVHTWSIKSPYSPLNLQHLPQPTPRGAPRNCEVRFTFRDAFEDLLIAGSGYPMPSLADLALKKRREAFMFVEYGGIHVTSWVGGLAPLGLWNAYFQMEPVATGRVGRGEKDVERQLYFRDSGLSWGMRRDGDLRGWEDRARRMGDTKGVWNAAWRVRIDRDRREGNREADVEDELYGAAVSGPPTNGTSERDSDNSRRVVGWLERGALSKPSAAEVTTTVHADGSKYVKTTERFERDGKTSVTTTAQHFDAAGNLTSESRDSSNTRSWSGTIPGAEASVSWSWNSGTGAHNRKNSDDDERDCRDDDDRSAGREDRKEEKKGWFWNR